MNDYLICNMQYAMQCNARHSIMMRDIYDLTGWCFGSKRRRSIQQKVTRFEGSHGKQKVPIDAICFEMKQLRSNRSRCNAFDPTCCCCNILLYLSDEPSTLYYEWDSLPILCIPVHASDRKQPSRAFPSEAS
jgi:hypothetical protein